MNNFFPYRMLLASIGLLSMTSCTLPATDEAAPTSDLTDERTTSVADQHELIEAQLGQWKQISAGVWERPRAGGGTERFGAGRAAFAFALQEATQQHLDLLATEGSAAGSAPAEEVERSTERLRFLEQAVESANETPQGKGDDLLSPMVSGRFCAGNYSFTVNMVPYTYASVTATANWSEFGPFAPYYKTMNTYARAEMNDGSGFSNVDSDSFGPWRGYCCVNVQSTANTGPTFTPRLYGLAYLTSSNCSDPPRFYEAKNY